MYYDVRLSSYTLAELDDLLGANPLLAKMSKSSRINLYNFAQEEIARLRDGLKISQLPTTTTANNKLLYIQSGVNDIYLYNLKQEDLANLRGSLFTLGYVDEILDQHIALNSLSKKQRTAIYNLAQQNIANLRNKYLSDEYTIDSTSYDKTIPSVVSFIIEPSSKVEVYIVNDSAFTAVVSPSCFFGYTTRMLQDSSFEMAIVADCTFSYSVSGGVSTSRTYEKVLESVVSVSVTAHTVTPIELLTEGSVVISYLVTGP